MLIKYHKFCNWGLERPKQSKQPHRSPINQKSNEMFSNFKKTKKKNKIKTLLVAQALMNVTQTSKSLDGNVCKILLTFSYVLQQY